MAGPILLVHDDIAVIASIRRLLARDSYEVVLATSAADAVIAFGHFLPSLVIVSPSLEGGRGQVVLEELSKHPDGKLARILLLGESIPGFGYPVAPLPLDGATFLPLVQGTMRASTDAGAWQVREPGAKGAAEGGRAPSADPWRATVPSPKPSGGELVQTDWERAAMSLEERAAKRQVAQRVTAVADAAIEQASRELEAEAMASLDAAFQGSPATDEPPAPAAVADDELQKLEDDVRAEAARRRALRSRPNQPVAAPEAEPASSATVDEEVALQALRAQAEQAAKGDQAQAQRLAQQAALEDRLGLGHFDDAPALDLGASTPEVPSTEHSPEPTPGPDPEGASDQAPIEPPRPDAEALAAAEQEIEAARVERAAHETAERERAAREAATRARAIVEAAQRGARERGERSDKTRDELRRAQEVAERLGREVERAKRQADRAEELVRREREERARLEADLESQRAAVEQARTAAEESARQRQDALHEQTRQGQEELERFRAEAEAARELLAEHEAKQASQRRQLEEALQEERTRVEAAERARQAAVDEAAKESEQLERLRAQLLAKQKEERARREASVEKLRAEAEAKVQTERERLEAEADERVKKERAERARVVAEAEKKVKAEQAERARLVAEADEKAKAEQAERERLAQELVQAKARADELRRQSLVTLELSGERLEVPLAGRVDLRGLAELMVRLIASRRDLRLELQAGEAVRTLWLSRGALVASRSAVPSESLLDRARRDGLIDDTQEGELRLFRSATPREAVEVLLARGFIREPEVLPLLERHAEHIALEALSEPDSVYRLKEEPPPGVDEGRVAATRPALRVVVEALRRALGPDELLGLVGGLDAVPSLRPSELELEALGLSEKERRLLAMPDGKTSVGELLAASGLGQDRGLRALVVARYLALIDLTEAPPRPASGVVDVKRLEAKFRQVQDADYFTILGLSRSAGAEEVQRAYRSLAAEFSPLKFTAHPDGQVWRQAEAVHRSLSEAATALSDDRLRAEYARHLVE